MKKKRRFQLKTQRQITDAIVMLLMVFFHYCSIAGTDQMHKA